MSIRVIGAGLAGCEAAWQAAEAGIPVDLYEMKPLRFSPAHHSDNFCELVCSNSLKAERLESAAGLLKEEMRRLGSLLTDCAKQCRVPAGGALAVDRDAFAALVTQKIRSHPLIRIHSEEITELHADGITVVATGPLTADKLAAKIAERFGGSLSFFDAAAPIVTAESLNRDRIFAASRYGRGEDDAYLNCPMNKEEYEYFASELVHAQRAPLHDFDTADPKVYEGCMPVEIMAQRGENTLRFGPMKPVGLRDPKTGHRPWAVLQLRQENAEGSIYNLVGFQTNLTFGEQKRVFGLIPGLENADYMRFGVMHRNTFLNSPEILNADFSVRSCPNLFFAGQITGVEGYMESAFSGIIAGINAVRRHAGLPGIFPPEDTMTGALSSYAAHGGIGPFQPMGANFGILPPLGTTIRDKRERYAAFSERALQSLDCFIKNSMVGKRDAENENHC